MKAALRCGAYVLLWSLLFPALSVVGSYAMRYHKAYLPPSGTWEFLFLFGGPVLVAIWIYWRKVPVAPNWPLRLLYLALYLAALIVACGVSFQVAFFLVVALFGL